MKNAETISLFVLKDWDFHLAVARATHNQLMNTLMEILGGLLHKETSKIIKYSETTKDDTINITKKLLDALRNRDSERAKELMIKHLRVIDILIKDN